MSFFQIAALMLCSSRNSFKRYGSLDSFEELCTEISPFIPSNIHELNTLQFSLIEKFEANLTSQNLQVILDTFDYLEKQKTLNKENHRKLKSLFSFDNLEKKEEIVEEVDDDTLFTQKKEEIESLMNELSEIFEDEASKIILEDTSKYLKEQKFSIGITGVMNSGKSTMLNALLGKEILGTSVVPETANLSVLKYSKEQYAKVHYWNKAQWEDIQRSSNDMESIKKFVDESKENFGDKLDDYIKEEARVDNVTLEELSSYTSAKSSTKKSNLVKYVELGVDLDFLGDGIEIVDTPGLDDPVVQREEITKEYISKCDLMLHLMNVSQSATLKDVDFIIDALLYQNVTKLLMVITKADTVKEEELHEVIEYVKRTIRAKLLEVSNSKLDTILQNLMIIPISSQMAMLHKIGKGEEAEALGYPLENTGITNIEDYLYDTLFGKDNEKTKLIIDSVKGKIHKAINIEKDYLEYCLVHLSKSTEELESELEDFKKQKNQTLQDYLLMEKDINHYKQTAKEYVELLESFLNGELESLNQEMHQRIINDVRYTFKTEKKKPEDERIKTIIITAVKDGVIDVIRDYRYKFVKKSETIFEQCHQKYNEMGLSLDEQDNKFDAVSFFGDDFLSGFLTSNNDILVNKVLAEVGLSKKNKLDELDIKVANIISKETVSLHQKLKEKANNLSLELLESFFDILNTPLLDYKQDLTIKENTLNKMIEKSKDTQENRESNSIAIHEKLRQIQNLEQRCKF